MDMVNPGKANSVDPAAALTHVVERKKISVRYDHESRKVEHLRVQLHVLGHC